MLTKKVQDIKMFGHVRINQAPIIIDVLDLGIVAESLAIWQLRPIIDKQTDGHGYEKLRVGCNRK
jgi:hypothetical protein